VKRGRQSLAARRPAEPALPDPATLLAWYDRHRRDLPWRAARGEESSPYRVWLSEIMLQQTTVRAVAPYFERFLARFPDLEHLAAAPLEEVLTAWAGLGYYSRARNLHACAKAVMERHGGEFPRSEAELAGLPGIGAYTAAAIASIAFDERTVPVDGNVERVVTRLLRLADPLPAAKPAIRAIAARLAPQSRNGDFAQALMDLGATICSPRRPRCVLCPWRTCCAAAASGLAEELPARPAKPERPQRYGIAFWLTRPDGAVLLRRRPEKGLLGGMIEIPSTPWSAAPWQLTEALPVAPAAVEWSALPGSVRHGFTHFQLELAVATGKTDDFGDGLWSPVDRFGEHALPTLMKKVVRHALSALAARSSADVATRAAKRGISPSRASRTGSNDRR